MEKKKFEVEVEEIKTQVDKNAKAKEDLKFLLETETELAVKFSEGLRLLGRYVYDDSVAKMIAAYKNYQSDGYSDDEAVAAVMWKEVKWASTPSSKVEAAIEKLLAYNPSRKASWIKFKNGHRFLMVASYLVWCGLMFIGFQYWVNLLFMDQFLRVFILTAVSGCYLLFTFSFLDKKSY